VGWDDFVFIIVLLLLKYIFAVWVAAYSTLRLKSVNLWRKPGRGFIFSLRGCQITFGSWKSYLRDEFIARLIFCGIFIHNLERSAVI